MEREEYEAQLGSEEEVERGRPSHRTLAVLNYCGGIAFGR